MKITKKYRDPSRTKMYMVGNIPESLRYCRVRHNVKMKIQESVINGETQSEALGISSVLFHQIVLYLSVLLTKDYAIARQYTALVKMSR